MAKATQLILVLPTDHSCKVKIAKQLTEVMDGKRVSKKGMQELTQTKGDTLADFIKTYALYKFDLSSED
ncbi:hypothetical protein FGO68_gene13971 [Halteria grandinella]|uniref:Uncharacterized protein n=1 Tax=Halteria grandinella TaxID=5974 RepID=A0A8J8T156_HALGN|nr:hypothetical protein FGO68_gene13971 [Halteria grandinella]